MPNRTDLLVDSTGADVPAITAAGDYTIKTHLINPVAGFVLGGKVTTSANGGLTLLNSEDNVHFNATGQLVQATALRPLLDAALTADGYTIQ